MTLLYPSKKVKASITTNNPVSSKETIGPSFDNLSPRRLDWPEGIGDPKKTSAMPFLNGAANGEQYFNAVADTGVIVSA